MDNYCVRFLAKIELLVTRKGIFGTAIGFSERSHRPARCSRMMCIITTTTPKRTRSAKMMFFVVYTSSVHSIVCYFILYIYLHTSAALLHFTVLWVRTYYTHNYTILSLCAYMYVVQMAGFYSNF